MHKEYFVIRTIELAKNVLLEILFDKEAKVEELYECDLKLIAYITKDQSCTIPFHCRYVFNDKMIGIEDLVNLVMDHLEKMIKLVESVDSGINITRNFILEQPGLAASSVEVRRDLKKSLQNLTKYKIEPFIIDLYNSVLVKYKGTDTLQKRKLKKMIEAQEDAMRYSQTRRMF